MSIGFGSIGEEGIGEGGLPGVFVPLIVVAVTANTPPERAQVEVPRILTGASINVPTIIATVFFDPEYGDAIGEESIGAAAIASGGLATQAIVLVPANPVTVTIHTPVITAGKSVFVDALNVTAETLVPFITHSATVTVPNLVIAVATHTPKLEIAINTPYVFIGVLPRAPMVSTGKKVDIPNKSITVNTNAPIILTGVKIEVPNVVVSAVPEEVIISIGLNIKAWNTATVQVPLGTIASAAISSTAIGEDDSEARETTYSAIVQVVLNSPIVVAGKQVKVPNINVTANTNRPEIAARTRRVRVQIISY